MAGQHAVIVSRMRDIYLDSYREPRAHHLETAQDGYDLAEDRHF